MAAFATTTDQPGEGTLASRIAAAPQLSARDSAEKRVDDWLRDIDDHAAGVAVRRLLAAHPQLRALILGLADGSPHLWEFASADPSRLAGLLESEPETRFDAVLADTISAIAKTRD